MTTNSTIKPELLDQLLANHSMTVLATPDNE
jgi:hypothetical protein